MENVTDQPDYNDSNRELPASGPYIIHKPFSLLICAVTFLLGTTGNGLVIWIAGFKMPKTVSVVWFLNLAIANLIFTLFLPLGFAHVALDYDWLFGTFLCKLTSAITFLNMFASVSVFILTVINIDRCVCVVFPVWAQNHRTPAMASMVVIVVWIVAIYFSLSYFIFRDTYNDNGHVDCYEKFHNLDNDLALFRRQVIVITQFIFGFFVPFLVIVACYTIITLWLRRNKMTRSTQPYKTILAVQIMFFFCWFPFHVFCFLDISYQPPLEDSLKRILVIMAYITSCLVILNSCVNPFLYVYISQDIKTAFRTPIQMIIENAFSEDSFQHRRYKSRTVCDTTLF